MTQPRTVRCARCGQKWTASAAAEESPRHPEEIEPEPEQTSDWGNEPAEQSPTVVTAMDRLAAAAPPQPRRAGLAAGWVVTGVVLIVAVAATITWRQQVVRVWPASSRILGSPTQLTSAPVPQPGTEPAHTQAAKD
jgi:hypothetical protein